MCCFPRHQNHQNRCFFFLFLLLYFLLFPVAGRVVLFSYLLSLSFHLDKLFVAPLEEHTLYIFPLLSPLSLVVVFELAFCLSPSPSPFPSSLARQGS